MFCYLSIKSQKERFYLALKVRQITHQHFNSYKKNSPRFGYTEYHNSGVLTRGKTVRELKFKKKKKLKFQSLRNKVIGFQVSACLAITHSIQEGRREENREVVGLKSIYLEQEQQNTHFFLGTIIFLNVK